MSGICGIYNYHNDEKVSLELLAKMVKAIRHRGPKFKEVYLNNNIGLAVHYFQSDVQARCNHKQRNFAVIDGKIYNKKELNGLIAQKGVLPFDNYDSQILICAYELFGDDFVKKLDGEFSFCLWDDINKKLILARNHAGNRPLYYYIKDTGIVFGSEIKAVLADATIKREIDPIALDAYFTLHDVPTPDTLFKGIKQVPAGTLLVVQNGQVNMKPYWRYNSQNIDCKLRENECSEVLYGLLSKAVKKRLQGEENAGAFLSSGLDSSIVTLLVKQALNRSFKVFSVGFQDEELNELPYARKTAEFLGVDMCEMVVDVAMAREALFKAIHHTDLPFYDSSAIPTYYAGLLASQNSSLVLTGDGSDQLLAGSMVYAQWKKQSYLFPDLLRVGICGNLIRPFCSLNPDNDFWEKVLRNTRIECLPRYQRFSMRNDILKYPQKEEAYNHEFRKQLNGSISYQKNKQWFENSNRSNFIDQLLYRDVSFFLHDDLLVKVDRMLNASSMDFRTPFLDIEVMDFISRMPIEYKIKGVLSPVKKYILKKAFKRYLPDFVTTNRKTGFEPPYRRWMRNELKEIILDNILAKTSGINIYFKPGFVKKTVERFYSGEYLQNWRLIWAWFMFELWYKGYIENKKF